MILLMCNQHHPYAGCHLAGIFCISIFVCIEKEIFSVWFQDSSPAPGSEYSSYIVAAVTIIFANFIFIVNVGGMASRANVIYVTLLFSFLILTLIFVLVSNRLKQEQRRSQQLELYIKTIDELSEELRRFKHNYLNILHGLSGYAELEEWGQLREYIDDLVAGSRRFRTHSTRHVTGNCRPRSGRAAFCQDRRGGIYRYRGEFEY